MISVDDISITYSDIPNIANIYVDELISNDYEELALVGLFGNAYKLLPKEMIYKEGGKEVVDTFEYKLDDDGYVKSVTATSSKYKSTTTREFIYEDIK